MRPFHDEAVLKAVLVLRSHPDFGAFVAEIGGMLEDHNRRLVHSDQTNSVFVEQGAVRVLTEILDGVTEAPERLQQRERQQQEEQQQRGRHNAF